MYTRTVKAVVALIALSFSLYLLFSPLPLFLSLSGAASQPPGRAMELIDCALQIDFEQKVSVRSLVRRPGAPGVKRGRPGVYRAASAARPSLKSSSTL